MKTFTVFDYYENPFGTAIYISHDIDDCKKFCREYAKEVDGECNLIVKEDRKIMKSEWRVSSQYCGGEKIYQVYRIRNVNETDHSGNREYKGGIFRNESEAKKYAEQLNNEED